MSSITRKLFGTSKEKASRKDKSHPRKEKRAPSPFDANYDQSGAKVKYAHQKVGSVNLQEASAMGRIHTVMGQNQKLIPVQELLYGSHGHISPMGMRQINQQAQDINARP